MSANDNFAGISFGYDADKIFKERDETMCNRWTCNKSRYADCNIDVYSNPLGNFIIKGRTNNWSRYIVERGALKGGHYRSNQIMKNENLLKEVIPTESELKASFSPSTVPLITPLSKPNKKPPIVATTLIRKIKIRFSFSLLSFTKLPPKRLI